MKNKKHYKAIIMTTCFIHGTPLPPKGAMDYVYLIGITMFFGKGFIGGIF